MSYLNFQRIEITDKERAEECLRRSDFRGSEYTFGNNFVWRKAYNVEVCFYEDLYFIKQGEGSDTRFVYPAGGVGETDEAGYVVGLIGEYAKENGLPLRIIANKAMTDNIAAACPKSCVKQERDYDDYIYLAEELENLKGKKFHSKRNHLNRFYENDWSFEPLTSENIPECIEMNKLWRSENIDSCPVSKESQSKIEELCVVECSFKYFDKLKYTGGVLRVGGEVQAFTFGEPSADNCFVVHAEKALRGYQGAYTAINREFVKALGGRYKYINREDDTGSEGLRKAKLSYNPVFMEEKFQITFDNEEMLQ